MKLNDLVKKSFAGVKLTETPIYFDETKNKEAKELHVEETELNKTTVEYFWDLFKSNAAMNTMYFRIGSSDSQDEDKIEKFGPKNPKTAKKEYYLVIKFENDALDWSPTTMDDIDWDNEINILRKDVCNYFKLEFSDELAFETIEDNIGIDCGDDLETNWDDLIDPNSNVNEKYIELKIIDAKRIGPKVEVCF